jgi:hypothetical protein
MAIASLIDPTIGEPRQELAPQVAVGGVDSHAGKPDTFRQAYRTGARSSAWPSQELSGSAPTLPAALNPVKMAWSGRIRPFSVLSVPTRPQ